VQAAGLRHGLARTGRRGRALAHVLARNSAQGARVASAWTATTSRAAATSTRAGALHLQRNLSTGAAWSGAKAKATAQSSVAASRATYVWAASWATHKMHYGSNGYLRAKPSLDQNHRALVVRRSTALIRFEPKQGPFPPLPAG
jgi:hypothetical protein